MVVIQTTEDARREQDPKRLLIKVRRVAIDAVMVSDRPVYGAGIHRMDVGHATYQFVRVPTRTLDVEEVSAIEDSRSSNFASETANLLKLLKDCFSPIVFPS